MDPKWFMALGLSFCCSRPALLQLCSTLPSIQTSQRLNPARPICTPAKDIIGFHATKITGVDKHLAYAYPSLSVHFLQQYGIPDESPWTVYHWCRGASLKLLTSLPYQVQDDGWVPFLNLTKPECCSHSVLVWNQSEWVQKRSRNVKIKLPSLSWPLCHSSRDNMHLIRWAKTAW